MEPTNRPYVDPHTEPGDAGTEPWADDRPDAKAGEGRTRRPSAGPAAPAEEGGAIDGSPADHFLTDDVVSAENEDPDRAAGDK
jgi:hypothetical protein